jgi:hypothetical protein
MHRIKYVITARAWRFELWCTDPSLPMLWCRGHPAGEEQRTTATARVPVSRSRKGLMVALYHEFLWAILAMHNDDDTKAGAMANDGSAVAREPTSIAEFGGARAGSEDRARKLGRIESAWRDRAARPVLVHLVGRSRARSRRRRVSKWGGNVCDAVRVVRKDRGPLGGDTRDEMSHRNCIGGATCRIR